MSTYEMVQNRRSHLPEWFAAFGVSIVSFLVFAPTLRFGFVNYDDPPMVVDNPFFRGLGWQNLKWMWSTLHTGPYQPLSWMSLGLDYVLWGVDDAGELKPFGFHLTNVLLHSLNVTCVYFLTLRLLEFCQDAGNAAPKAEDSPTIVVDVVPRENGLRNINICSAMIAAFFFGVHPLRVEVVAWITERRELLATTFSLCFLLAYIRYARSAGATWSRKSGIAYVISLVFFSLSLLAKAMGMTWPIGLLILDVYPLRRLEGWPSRWLQNPHARSVLREKVPFILIAIPVVIAAGTGQAQAGAMTPWSQHPLSARLTQYAYALIWYLRLELLPYDLCPLYAINPPILPFSLRFFPSLLAFVVMTLALLLFRRSWPGGLAAWALYVVLLAPVSGLAQSGEQLVADRYTYVPCLPFAVLMGGFFRFLWLRLGHDPTKRSKAIVRRSVLSVGAVVMLLGFCSLTFFQSQIWSNSIDLWRQVIRVSPSSKAELNLGYLLQQAGRLDEAEPHLFKSANAPSIYDDISCYFLGNLYRDQGRLDEALQYYQKAETINPGYSDPLCQMGRIYAARGDYAQARQYLEKILQRSPGYAEGWIAMGDLTCDEGNRIGALRYYQRATQVRPDLPVVHERLALALRDLGKSEEALNELGIALRSTQRPIPSTEELQGQLDALKRPTIVERKKTTRVE